MSDDSTIDGGDLKFLQLLVTLMMWFSVFHFPLCALEWLLWKLGFCSITSHIYAVLFRGRNSTLVPTTVNIELIKGFRTISISCLNWVAFGNHCDQFFMKLVNLEFNHQIFLLLFYLLQSWIIEVTVSKIP